MNYCEKCRNLCEEEYCQTCNNTQPLRPVQNDDYCYFVKTGRTFGERLCKHFEGANIPCALVPEGDGVRAKLGIPLENCILYVPYEFFGKACNIYDYLTVDNVTDLLRKDLLENEDKWVVKGERLAKKMMKKLKCSSMEEFFDACYDCVKNAVKIVDDGIIGAGPERQIIVYAQGKTIMFNSDTYEILYASLA